MATISSFWSMFRSPKSRFAPGRIAADEQHLSARRADAVIQADPPEIPAPSHAVLRTGGEKMLLKSRALGRAPALAVLQIDDLPELELLFGRAAVDAVLQAAFAGMTRASAGLGLVARTAPDTFALMMPGGGAKTTAAAIRTSFGAPCSIEVGFGRDDILVVPEMRVHAFGPQDEVEQVYGDLCRSIAKARGHERGVHDQVPPAPRASSPMPEKAQSTAREYCPPLPPTIPMPLRVH